MNHSFVVILDTIKQAWEQLNPELLKTILAEKITYLEDPNEPALTSINAVIKRWQTDLETHSNVMLTYEIAEVEANDCIANWPAEWDDSKRGHQHLRGVYFVRIDNDKKLSEFRQWWL